ncbi:hypothetical protein [Bacillus sp. SG-1]|uniref:hypothetical protein n=1 Tax=Bacillus sp. SG-1 TaxID=161544 RepID=UPI00015436F0|nr:hypothetical protein [Bacillus sp. SG-1]EDL64955.1 hypothetical protein BSG1_20555 [Bacillus sp. SG-1]
MAVEDTNRKAELDQQKVVKAQNKSDQFQGMDTEFSLDEYVQRAVANSQQYQAQHQQPTYEPNKPL